MGGAQAGELASRLAAAAIEEHTRTLRGIDAVEALVREANARIYKRAVEDPAAAGMGTTATVALVDETEETMAIAHVGDSRAYRLRGDALEQLTADHSLVAELVRSGRLTEEEAAEHPHKSVITRALGTEPDVDVDTLTVQIEPGDLYLVCSDGLTHMVTDAEVLSILGDAGGDPERIAGQLVDAANRAGGEDNITVIVFEAVDGLAEVDGQPAEPDEVTAESQPQVEEEDEEDVAEPEPAPAEPPVQRHGAGAGSRAVALAAIVVAACVVALLVYWGLGR
jgi:protein phosphatase